uniref:Uncharacterized protein n=1 Tax=Anguilla anguilla TaxID=7936 RepID=A0A0E9QEV9_ANGAN
MLFFNCTGAYICYSRLYYSTCVILSCSRTQMS